MPRLLKWVGALLLILVGAALAVVIQKASGLSAAPNEDLSYAEFTGVILSALGVIIAALTLFLGAVAVVGWTAFESMVKQKSENFLEKRFSPEDQRYTDLLEEIKEDVRREMSIQRQSKKEAIENTSPFDESAI